MKKKVLVTGGAGYVGSVLVPKLINFNFDIMVLDSMIFGSQGLNKIKNQCEIIKGDIRNYDLVKKCLEGVDSVIHLAAIANDPCGNLNPELTNQVNYKATKNLVRESKKKGVKRFIYASSSSVYGFKEEENVTEDLILEPLTIYSKTKAWSEKAIKIFNDKNFITTSIRSATICGYSPRQRLDLIVNILISSAINKGEIKVNGGYQYRPNIHIEDITNLYRDLLFVKKEKISGEIFNYGEKNYTVNEIANIIKGVIGKHIKIKKNPKTKDSRSYRISSEKIKKVLGFEPKKTITNAASDLKQAFNDNLIPNPEDTIYRNVKKMQEIGIENFVRIN